MRATFQGPDGMKLRIVVNGDVQRDMAGVDIVLTGARRRLP